MTRMQQYKAEVERISLEYIKANMPEPRMLVVDICFDLPNEFFTWAWSTTKIASGLQKSFIEKCGFEVCKKSDATICMLIGEKDEITDMWISGKYKKYWLKPKQ